MRGIFAPFKEPPQGILLPPQKKTGTTYFQRAVSVIICVTVYAIFAYEKKNLTSLSCICVILFFFWNFSLYNPDDFSKL